MTHGKSSFGPEPKQFNSKHIQHHSAKIRSINQTSKIYNIHKYILYNYRHKFIDITTILHQETKNRTQNPRQKKIFNTLSTSDLQHCIHCGNIFFCKGKREMRTDTEQTCLTSLYLRTMTRLFISLLGMTISGRRHLYQDPDTTQDGQRISTDLQTYGSPLHRPFTGSTKSRRSQRKTPEEREGYHGRYFVHSL